MSYSDQRMIFSFLIDTKARDGQNDMSPANGIADNTDLHAFVIPAGKEVEIQNLLGYVFAADADAFIELVKEDNTVISKLSCVATGAVAGLNSDGTTATTFPQRIAPQSTSALKVLKLRSDQALDVDTKISVQVHISGLSAK